MTFSFIKIASLDDLNITTLCLPHEYNISTLKIFAQKNILLNNDLDLHGVLNIINRTNFQNDIIFQNINGFNENTHQLVESKMNNNVRSIQIMYLNFDFYQQGKLISENCTRMNFDSKTNFFGSLRVLFLEGNVFYNNKICPYVFMNTKLMELYLIDISNSLIFRNRVEFLSINETKLNNLNIKELEYLILTVYCETISWTNLNPFVFKNLKVLQVDGNIEHFDENLFEIFDEIRSISVKSDELINFFHRGTKWLNSINRNLNFIEFRHNIHKLVTIEFAVQGWSLFNKYYTFPNEDICLFKNFPHTQLVLPIIIFDPIKFDSNDCSCTHVWLVQYYKFYFTNNFTNFNQYITLQPQYEDLFKNETVNKCLRNEQFFNEKFLSCNFSQRFVKCNFTQFTTVSSKGVLSIIHMIKWFQYVIEVYIRTFLCLTGLITNILTLKVIGNKKHKKNFSNSMYKHICANAFFNAGFCLIYIFSLLNICIYPKTSYCSSVWHTKLAQYFHIFVVAYLGNTFRLSCNISYIFFSVSRVALSGTTAKNRLRTLIEKQNIKLFYIIIIISTLGFSIFLVFENNVNLDFQDFIGLNNINSNNAYDIKYCESFSSQISTRKFILTPGFYVKCKVFKWLNIINNVLNNVLLLFKRFLNCFKKKITN